MSEWKIKLPFNRDCDNLLYIESNYDLELVFQKDETIQDSINEREIIECIHLKYDEQFIGIYKKK